MYDQIKLNLNPHSELSLCFLRTGKGFYLTKTSSINNLFINLNDLILADSTSGGAAKLTSCVPDSRHVTVFQTSLTLCNTSFM